MVEPISSSGLLIATKVAMEAGRETGQVIAREALSKGLRNASAEVQGAVKSQLSVQSTARQTFLSEAGRPPTALEKSVTEQLKASCSENLVDGKRLGLKGELKTHRYLWKAEKSGLISDLRREPSFGRSRLDFEYVVRRKIRIPEKLTGERWRINPGEIVAHEQKSGSPEYLLRQLRGGRLGNQVEAALRAKRHVVVTVDRATMADARVQQEILKFKEQMVPLSQPQKRALVFTSRM